MKYARYFLTAAFALAALPVFAASACYTPEQLKAEQTLRLHSELMVITVTCRQGSQGQSLPAAYGDFTKKNIGLLHNAEQTMISYYGNPGATAKLDRLRTKLANEYGQKAADMSSASFCAAYRDKVVQFESATPQDIEKEVQRMETSERSYAKPCGRTAHKARKKK